MAGLVGWGTLVIMPGGVGADLVNRPRLSVVLPCYNHGSYLPEAIASVRKQTFLPVEIIVVNDGSTDQETLALLAEFSESDIKVLHTANLGLAAARNHGIDKAAGEYILPLDADDRIAPGYLEAAVRELEGDSQVGIVYGQVEFFGERQGLWSQSVFSPERLLYENMIVASAVFRRADWKRVGGYRETMRYGWEDWDFWLSLVELGCKVVKLPEVVFHYRIRKNSMTRSLSKWQKFRMLLRLIRNHPRLYVENFWSVFRGLSTHALGLGK
jgi:glycosyltransferase involved in cell wall biosynthesis